MPKTVQIRDIDDDVYAGLVRRAGEEGITVPELLRREAARLAIEKALASLTGKLDAKAQARLIDQSIQSLGNA